MNTRCQFRRLAAAPLLAMLAIAGCGGKVRYPTMYVLNLPPPAPRTSPPAEPVLGSLEVQEFRCPEHLCEGRIVYRPSPEQVGFYDYHRWAMSPSQAVTRYVADTVRAQSIFKSVTVAGRDTRPAYVLSGSIDQFEEVDQGRDVRALCTISAQLVDGSTGSVVWTQTASQAVPVGKRNVPGVVVSLSAAARATVDRLVQSMTSQLARARTH